MNKDGFRIPRGLQSAQFSIPRLKQSVAEVGIGKKVSFRA